MKIPDLNVLAHELSLNLENLAFSIHIYLPIHVDSTWSIQFT